MSNSSSPKSRNVSRSAKKTTSTRGKTVRRRKRKEPVDQKPWLSGRKPELHLHLFEIPISRAWSGADYLVLMEGKPGWHRAMLEGRAWWVGDELLGRLADSAIILPTPERLLHALEHVAWRLSAAPDAYDTAGDRQYYIERDVIDFGNSLICHRGGEELNSLQQLTIFRHLQVEAATMLVTPPGLDEIVVGHCVLDADGNRVFEHVLLEECWLHARDRKGDWLDRLGVVFADGSVKVGHELAQRPWLEMFRQKRKPRRKAAASAAKSTRREQG